MSCPLELSYTLKEKTYKPIPEFITVDQAEYEAYNEELLNNSIRKKLINTQIKYIKGTDKSTFTTKNEVEFHLNNQAFHWFNEGSVIYLYGLSLDEKHFHDSTIDQPVGLTFIIEVDDRGCRDQY